MNVAFDARETSHMSAGMLLYVRKLQEWMPRVAPDLPLVPVGGGDNFDLAEQCGLPFALLRSRAGLAHLPTPYVPLWVPLPYVITIHDVIDLEFPEFAKRTVGPYYRRVVGPALRRARAVITDDRATSGMLERYLGVDPARMTVIPLGCDAEPRRSARPVMRPRPYFFYAGNHRPHKNLDTLVSAWDGLPPDRECDLVLTGDADVLHVAPRPAGEIVFIGDVPGEELADWYAGALAYVHPALREGFGLPMLEAMRAATPVIAADTAVPEVLAEHVQTFAATDVLALRALLDAALADPHAMLIRGRGARDATDELTWEATALATAGVYRRFLA